MVCGVCGASIGQVSGKNGGYYGCLGAAKGACENRILVARKVCEDAMILALRERVLTDEAITYVTRRIEEEIERESGRVPEAMKIVSEDLHSEERRIGNLVEFISQGRASKAVADALEDAEARAQVLRRELGNFERMQDKPFHPPSKDWIARQLSELREVLERRTGKSALVLRRALGKIRLVPTCSDVSKPHYVALSKLNVLELLEDKETDSETADGSNSLHWWRRRESNPIHVAINRNISAG
jgi:hypothetical protein